VNRRRPALTVIIPWCDRPEIKETLCANGEHLAAARAEVIVVACGGDQKWLAPALVAAKHPGLDLTLVAFDYAPFNKSLALNLAAAQANAGVLLVLDSDILLEPTTLPFMLDALTQDSYVRVKNVCETQAEVADPGSVIELGFSVTIGLDDGRSCTVETSTSNPQTGSRSGVGLIMVARQHFVEVGGMNSNLEGWGWEDIDLAVRLQLGLNLRAQAVGDVRHLTHESQTDSAGTQSMNMSTALRSYNAGSLQGSFDDDVVEWESETKVYR